MDPWLWRCRRILTASAGPGNRPSGAEEMAKTAVRSMVASNEECRDI